MQIYLQFLPIRQKLVIFASHKWIGKREKDGKKGADTDDEAILRPQGETP